MVNTLVLDDDLADLARSARAFIRTHSPLTHVRAIAEEADARDPDLWLRAAREIGVQGVLVADEQGGAGGDMRAAALLAEELGAALVPGPFIPTLIASYALGLAKDADFSAVLTGIADGGVTAVLVPVSDDRVELEVTRRNGVASVSGTIAAVHDGSTIDLLVVLADDEAGSFLVVLERDEKSWSAEAVSTVDVTRRYARVRLSGAAGRVGVLPLRARDLVVAAADTLVSAGQLGLMRRTLDDTIEYCSQREAFGRVVGSFQAVKHQLAELTCTVAQAEALVRDAAAGFVEAADEAPLAAATALCVSGPAGTNVAAQCLRLLGGIGYTWEHDAHLYFRRARVDEVSLGRPQTHRHRLAALLGLC